MRACAGRCRWRSIARRSSRACSPAPAGRRTARRSRDSACRMRSSRSPHDPDGAPALLRRAGWRDTDDDDGVADRDGEELSFTIMYFAGDSVRRDVALAVRSNLADVGIDAEVAGVGDDVVQERAKSEGTVFGWGVPSTPTSRRTTSTTRRWPATTTPTATRRRWRTRRSMPRSKPRARRAIRASVAAAIAGCWRRCATTARAAGTVAKHTAGPVRSTSRCTPRALVRPRRCVSCHEGCVRRGSARLPRRRVARHSSRSARAPRRG